MESQTWKKLIGSGKIDEAIEELLKYTSENMELRELNDILILQKSQYIDNEKGYHLKNIIPSDEYRINRVKVINALLKIIKEAENTSKKNISIAKKKLKPMY